MSDQSAPIRNNSRSIGRRASALLVPDVASSSSESSGPDTPIPLSRPESFSPPLPLSDSGDINKQPVSDNNDNRQGIPVAPKAEGELPPRLKLANAEDSSDIDTDTEIEQLTRGAVTLKDDKPPVLSPVGAMELEPIPNAESLPVRPPRLDDGNLVNLGGGQGEASGDISCQNSPDVQDIPKMINKKKIDQTGISGEPKMTISDMEKPKKENMNKLVASVPTLDHAEQIEVSADVDLDKTPEMRTGCEGPETKPKPTTETFGPLEPSSPPHLNVDERQTSTQPFTAILDQRQLALQTEEAIEDALETIGSSLPSVTHQQCDVYAPQLPTASQISPYQQATERNPSVSSMTGTSQMSHSAPMSMAPVQQPRSNQSVVGSPAVTMNRSFDNCLDRSAVASLESPRSAGSAHRASVEPCMTAAQPPPVVSRMATPQQQLSYQQSTMMEPCVRDDNNVVAPPYFPQDKSVVIPPVPTAVESKKRTTTPKKSKNSSKKQSEAPGVNVATPSQYQTPSGGFQERTPPTASSSMAPVPYGSNQSYSQQYSNTSINGAPTASQMPNVSPYKQSAPNSYNSSGLYYAGNPSVNPSGVTSAFSSGMMNGAYPPQNYANPYSSVAGGPVRPSYSPQVLATNGYLPAPDANFTSGDQFGNSYQTMAAMQIQTLQMQQAYGAAFNPYFQQSFNPSTAYFQPPGTYPGGISGQTAFSADPFSSYGGTVQTSPPRGPSYYGAMGFPPAPAAAVHTYPPSNFSLPGRK